MSRKKSLAEHVRDGTYRPSVHGPRPEDVPTRPSVMPTKPKSLKGDAGRAWNELAGLLADRLRPEDGPQLEQLAVWLAKWRQTVAALDAFEPGGLAFTRLIAALSTASKSFDRIGKKFGMAPLDRDALKMPAAPNNGARRW
jgi:hypothetical protein